MGEGIVGEAQDLANKLVDDAQDLANKAVDLGEEAVGDVLANVLAAASALMRAAESLSKAAIGK